MDKVQCMEEVKKVKAIFDAYNFPYWLDFGTLLGAIREGKMIAWDNDVDFCTLKQYVPKVLAALPEIGKLGFRVDVTDSCIYMHKGDDISISMGVYVVEGDTAWMIFTKTDPKFNSVLKFLDRIAEKAHYRKYHQNIIPLEHFVQYIIPPFMDGLLRRILFGICHLFGQKENAMVFPKKYFENLTTVSFEGLDFKVPSPPEEYLPLIYGETWRVPTKNWKWDDVCAMDYEFFKKKKRHEYSIL